MLENVLRAAGPWLAHHGYAAENDGVQVFGITVLRAQLALTRQRCAGLPVTLELMDHRNLQGRFDKIASVGMFEHVGPKNYRSFFAIARRLHADDGLLLRNTATAACRDHSTIRLHIQNTQRPPCGRWTRSACAGTSTTCTSATAVCCLKSSMRLGNLRSIAPLKRQSPQPAAAPVRR